jgi:membrane associated rhomboid family serine protease
MLPQFIRIPFIFVAICWGVWLIETVLHLDLGSAYGILPRTTEGLWGILFSPFLHGGLWHLIANSLPVGVLMACILLFYERIAVPVMVFIQIGTGLCVWLAARPAYHIGASGIIYGYAAFLFFSGLFRQEWKALFIAVFVFFGYGGLVWGVLPSNPSISWESHLLGALTGAVGAYMFRNAGKKIS